VNFQDFDIVFGLYIMELMRSYTKKCTNYREQKQKCV